MLISKKKVQLNKKCTDYVLAAELEETANLWHKYVLLGKRICERVKCRDQISNTVTNGHPLSWIKFMEQEL